MSLRDKDSTYTAKQEEADSNKVTTTASSSSRQWSGFKNPRVVRVSRTFGGKDRHSKVCTIRGLRDRRIRLSVPTAIQLYDLQDRLGLSQPSKVIDWLLDNTKHDIDKLPPLPIIPGTFTSFQGYGAPQSSSSPFLDANLIPSRREGININSAQGVDVDEDDQSIVAKLKYWDSNTVMRSKQKGVDHHDGVGDSHTSSQVLAQNFFPMARGNTSILPPHPGLLSNPMFNYYQWEPSSNLSLAQLGSLGLSSQNDNQGTHQSNSSQLPSSLSLSSGHLFLSPSMATTPLFPAHSLFTNTPNHQVENELRQFNRFHMSNSISSSLHNSSSLGLRPFPLSMSHDQPHMSQNTDDNQDKGDHHGH